MKKKVKWASSFKKDVKRYLHQPKKLQKIYRALSLLEQGVSLPVHYRPHRLSGSYQDYMELHIEGDLLLIWIEYTDDGQEVINLIRLGSHAELFGK